MHPVRSSARNSTARRAGATSSGLLDDEPVATGSGYVDEHHVHVEFIATLGDVPRSRRRLRDHRGRDARRAGSAGVADRERPRPTRVPATGLHRDLAVHAVGRPSRRVLRWPTRAAARTRTPSARSSTPQPQPSTARPVGGTTRRSPRLVTEHAASRPDGVAYAADDGDLTWRALDECSDRIAGTLIATGAAPGARVGVLLPDGASVHAVYLACEKAGLTIVGIGARAGVREIRHLLGRTRASVLVTAAAVPRRTDAARFAGARGGRHRAAAPRRDPALRTRARCADRGRRRGERRGADHRVDARRAGDGAGRPVPRELDVGHDGIAQGRHAHAEPVALLPPGRGAPR